MQPDVNYSFIAEQHYDRLYNSIHDRNEDVSEECHECDGAGGWSSCCGAVVEDHTCLDCGELCQTVICHVCKGAGELEN